LSLEGLICISNNTGLILEQLNSREANSEQHTFILQGIGSQIRTATRTRHADIEADDWR
jgi:hypothetical protein